MYLLARAQVLSGRTHDALVMLQRLAEMGVVTDAVSDPDFGPARELPGWPEVANAIARAGTEPARNPLTRSCRGHTREDVAQVRPRQQRRRQAQPSSHPPPPCRSPLNPRR